MAKKKDLKEVKELKVEVTPEVKPTLDSSLPDKKQRHLR